MARNRGPRPTGTSFGGGGTPDVPLGSYVGGDAGAGAQIGGAPGGGWQGDVNVPGEEVFGQGRMGPGGEAPGEDFEEEMHQAAMNAKLGATTYRERPSSPWDMESGAGAYGDKMYGEAMAQQLADTTNFDAARAQQQHGRGQAGYGIGLLGQSARGGGGNELLRASALGGGGNEYLGQFARGEGDVAQAMHDRAMGQNLVSERVAAAQRDKLAGQIASQAASGRGGYDPATRRAAIGAMAELGQQGAATTAALGAQEAAQAGGQYQGIRMQGAQGYQRGVLGAQQAYQQGMLGSRQAYMGALQGQRAQDLGLMGAEQQDLGRQTAGALGKMGIAQGYQQLGVEEKLRREKAYRDWEQQQENNRYRAAGMRFSGYQAQQAEDKEDTDTAFKAFGAATKGLSGVAGGISKIGAGGGAAGGGGSDGASDPRAKKNTTPADMQSFLKTLGPLGVRKPATEAPTSADMAGAMANAFVPADSAAPPLTQMKSFRDMGSIHSPPPPGPPAEQPAPVGVHGHGDATLGPLGVLQSLQRAQEPPPIDIHQTTSDPVAKTNVEKAPMDEFDDSLDGYRYDYKDPEKHGYGTRTGVMAPDLEKSTVGRGLVSTGPDGIKMVDYDPKKIGPIMLAALGHLNDRIDGLQKKRG